MEPEDELGVLFHVSVSDVQPQVDHASRALAHRHRHRITWTSASAGFLVGVLVVTFVALSSLGRSDTPAQQLASQRWKHTVHLDANRLLIEPPAASDHVTLTRDETVAMLQSSRSGQLSVVAARWGRVSVRDSRGLPVPGFDKQPAWTVVFRVRDDATTCPTTATAAVDPQPDPGDYSGVQVFVVAGSDSKLFYSQTGSWSCGLPAAPVAQLPETAG